MCFSFWLITHISSSMILYGCLSVVLKLPASHGFCRLWCFQEPLRSFLLVRKNLGSAVLSKCDWETGRPPSIPQHTTARSPRGRWSRTDSALDSAGVAPGQTGMQPGCLGLRAGFRSQAPRYWSNIEISKGDQRWPSVMIQDYCIIIEVVHGSTYMIIYDMNYRCFFKCTDTYIVKYS